MNRVHRVIAARPWSVAAICAALAALLGLLACSTEPSAPVFDNPLDPAGPDGGDPFQVNAVYLNETVLVTWHDPGLDGITGYEVLRSLSQAGPYEILGTATVTTYTDTSYVPDAVNWYKVRALDANGVPTAISLVTPAELPVPPTIRIAPGRDTATRFISIWVRSATGDSAAVDSTEAFATAAGAGFAGTDTTRIDWDLGPADSNGVVKRFYVRVFAGGIPTSTVLDSVTVSFRPSLHLAGDPATVGSRRLDLVVTGDGVQQMRFAPSRAGLEDAAWLPAAATYDQYQLDATPDTQVVFGEFAGDFGFSVVDSVAAIPDSLAHVELVINGGSAATGDTVLTLRAVTAATEMRYAESPAELAATPWQPYAETTTFVHSGCAGDLLKTVYGQFRNDWFSPDPVSSSIQWLPPEVLTVTIDAPDTVGGGTTVTLAGTAHAGTCDEPLSAVEVDTGTGWQAATGLETWSFAWSIPSVAADSSVTIQARALAGAAAETTAVTVVVTP